MLDVDDFKHVNTVFGHPGGDRALVFIAGCLRESCRAGDVTARLGGDEFAVLVRDAAPEGMSALAERLLEAVRLGNSVRISVGWAIGGDDLLHDADNALAEAKRGGKDRALSAVSTDRREVEPVRRRGVAGLRARRAVEQGDEVLERAAALGDLEHRPDEDPVHVAHERVGLDR